MIDPEQKKEIIEKAKAKNSKGGDKITHAQNVGLPIEVQESTTCCFAVQDKVWVKGGELAWEWYTVLADAPSDTSLTPMPIMLGVPNSGSCCGPEGCD
jgi:hypothetical protein